MQLCSHFGACGGCQTMDLPYERQIADKHADLSLLLGRDVEVVPCESPSYYRNRMDFAVGDGIGGLFPRGEWGRIVDVHDCRLLSREAMPILRRVVDEVKRRGLEPYDRRRMSGFFRFVVIREGKFTGHRLVNLVTSSGDQAAVGEIARILMAEHPVTGVAHLLVDGVADLSRGRARESWGRGTIDEDLDGTLLAIGPNSFFQPNSAQARVLYRDIASHLEPYARLLDLFCGVGSIGLYTGAIVTGVDNDPENIGLARENARRCGGRAEFILRDAAKVEIGGYDALVVDPPRAGLHPDLARKIDILGPDLVIYVSCNPEALVRDLGRLVSYRVASLRGYDFSPHTRRLETLCVLRRP